MPTITDLIGPAGLLEAVLDQPALRTATGAPRSAVVFAHPHPQYGGTMHTKAVYQGAKGLARIGCAVLRFNFRGVGASEGEFDQRRRREGGLPGGAGLHGGALPGHAALGRGFLVRRVGGARDRRRRRPRLGADWHRAAGRDVGLGQNYTFPNTLASTKPKFFVQGEADEVCPLEGMWAVLRKARRAEGAGRDRRRAITCSRARRRKSARRSKSCLVISKASVSNEASRHRFRGAHGGGKAPNGALRYTRPDEMAAAVIGAALERAPGLDPAEVEDVILGCAMPEAEQGLNVARIAASAPACRCRRPR